jgi:hypothetical protein
MASHGDLSASDPRMGMAADRTDQVTALLIETAEAHGRYEASELGGVYDEAWADWYAAYAVDHGLGDLVGSPITPERFATFLTETNADFRSSGAGSVDEWVRYTTGRIVAEL